VFEHTGRDWEHEATLSPPEGVRAHDFGEDIALDGDRALIGFSGSVFRDPGMAVLFEDRGEGWTETARLDPRDSFSSPAWTGNGVALDGDVAMVGDPEAGGGDTGQVQLFERVNGSWQAGPVFGPDRDATARGFGDEISLDGTVALVGDLGGSSHFNSGGSGGGGSGTSAYVLVEDPDTGEWRKEDRLDPPEDVNAQRFGQGVGLDNGTAWVSDSQNRQRVDGPGYAVVFERVCGPERFVPDVPGEERVEEQRLPNPSVPHLRPLPSVSTPDPNDVDARETGERAHCEVTKRVDAAAT
jgi:hypothetical protein